MTLNLPHPDAEPRAAYVHVPFCVHRCGYCDFTVIAGRDQLIPAYLDALEIELNGLGSPRPVDTIFIGGGTPTHLPPKELSRLLTLVRYWFPPSTGAEFSVEANPADLDQRRIQVLAEHGVNRISLGVQAFDDRTLSLLERDHRRADIERTWELLRLYFENISLDLIFGVPGQTLQTWTETLQAAVALQPTHVSTYGLTYEKGTRFWTRRLKGELVPPGDDLERAMYALSIEMWSAARFEQYEISSFAKPGFRCRHNQIYWTGQQYFACGPGAARYINGRRESNHRSVTTWIQRLKQGQSPVSDSEELSAEDRARELIVLGLRRYEGIDANEFEVQTGFALRSLEPNAWQRHIATGFLEEIDGRIRLTREGRFVADSVIVDFL
jgi:oxygen-independent coproporphyrinogen-3 oxidase